MNAQDAASINIFFALLRSGMYGSPPAESELPDEIDWEAVIRLAQKHTVLGIVIDSIQFLPHRLRPTGSIAAKLNKFALGLIQANLVLEKAAARLAGFLNQHGISGVLLKGQGVARYYRIPQMRHSGDIDFYVGDRVYKKAIALCKEYLIKEPDPRHENDTDARHEKEQHFNFRMDGIPVELHRIASRLFTPFRNKRFQEWTVSELENAPCSRKMSVGNTDVPLPSCDFDAIYIFYHAWRHFITGGIGLRQLCDWSMILHNHAADIDREKLRKNLRRFGITNGWKLFGCIAVSHLGVAAEDMPLYDPSFQKKSEKILEEIMEGGNFGFYSKEYLQNRGHTTGLRYGLRKIRSLSSYFISLLPVIPLEATSLYLNRMIFGPIDLAKRSLNK